VISIRAVYHVVLTRPSVEATQQTQPDGAQ
jgi:hypothetical protein